MLLDEGTKKLVLDSEISGEWTGADPIITKSDLVKKATVTLNLSDAGTASILSAKLGIVVGVNTNNTNAICDLISINDEWYVRFREITSDLPITGQVTLDYLYIAVGASSKVQKRCSIIAANDAILIPHPEGFVTIVFNDTNRITVSGTTDNYQLREIRASDFLGI